MAFIALFLKNKEKPIKICIENLQSIILKQVYKILLHKLTNNVGVFSPTIQCFLDCSNVRN